MTDNYPLNGGKGMPYEGGSRVPLIIRWTGKIEGGIRSSVPITGVDFIQLLLLWHRVRFLLT